ncbi:hypothetical protein Tco_1385906 [Tanacetum coccineum]
MIGARGKKTRRNFALTVSDQGQVQRQYAGQNPKCAKWELVPWMNEPTTSGGNRPNPVLAIEGNRNQGNNGNQARGRAFVIGVAESPQDPNVVTGLISLNNSCARSI